MSDDVEDRDAEQRGEAKWIGQRPAGYRARQKTPYRNAGFILFGLGAMSVAVASFFLPS
jgi:hypothetical protein